MIRIERDKIQFVMQALSEAMRGARNPSSNLRIYVRPISDDELEKSAILALQSLAMDIFGRAEVAVPSDIGHFQSLVDIPFKEST